MRIQNSRRHEPAYYTRQPLRAYGRHRHRRRVALAIGGGITTSRSYANEYDTLC